MRRTQDAMCNILFLCGLRFISFSHIGIVRSAPLRCILDLFLQGIKRGISRRRRQYQRQWQWPRSLYVSLPKFQPIRLGRKSERRVGDATERDREGRKEGRKEGRQAAHQGHTGNVLVCLWKRIGICERRERERGRAGGR